MKLPITIDDPSLAEYEPLGGWLANLHSTNRSSRSGATQADDSFIKSMQQNVQAATAALKWAALLFNIDDQSSLELMDDGSGLYTAFLEYQEELLKGPDKAKTCAGRISKNGLDAIKLKETKRGEGAMDPDTTLGPRGARGTTYVTSQGNQCSSDSHTISGSGYDPCRIEIRVQAPGTEAQPPTPFNTTTAADGTTPISPEAAVPKKRSTQKRLKKRKASSQNPPVIAASDASEDDQGPSKTLTVTAANTASHRTKRIVTNPCPPDKPTHRSERNQLPREETKISEAQLHRTGPQSDNFVSSLSSRSGDGAQTVPSGRKYERSSNVSTQVARSSSTLKKVRRMKSTGTLPARANKRLRRALASDGEGEGLDIAHSTSLQEPTIQRTVGTDGPTQGNVRKGSNTRKKRTRLEFEGEFVACHETPSTNSNELLGPDIRSKRPLPRKICKRRSTPVMGEDTTVRGAPRGEPSLEYVDQALRDGAGNALAILREEVGPDVPDWTQAEEQDAECDDQDEVNDAQVDPPTCAPTPAISKPPLLAPPRIWAQTRQEVCESFEYFRSYHGGVYFKADIVRGYLLGAHAASRDIFHHGGKLIISHGGGKSDSMLDYRWGKPKHHQPNQDQQASDKSVRALLRTYEDKRPIVLLADDKYALFPYDLTSGGHTYVVLGFYWITHAWAECQSTRDGSGRVVRWKFAFQWCEGQGDPWWLPRQEMGGATPDRRNVSDPSTEDSAHHANAREVSPIRCETCQKQSPFVYRQGWTCLNPKCQMFWRIDGEDQLEYHEEFLKLLPDKLQRLPEITPTRVVETQDGVTTTYAFSKGLHCTNCGRLSCRFKWEHWECSNCQFKHVVTGRTRSPKEFWHQRPPSDFMHSRVAKDSGIIACRLEPINLGPGKGFTSRLTFILPHNRGKIHLILATPLSNREADDIFALYQRQASTGELKLRRYPLRSHRVRGQLLTNYFSQNSGEPYQYVGGTGNTVPFSAAPECVQRALAVIKERSSLALHIDIPYNEILSAAYMERQKMSFHSDSEKGLGPIVASLSLGSAALMHFRLHGNLNAENPAPKNKCGHALTLVLRHGDVLIMEGEGVQKCYEHTVVPMNFRIAATARCIGST